MKQLLKVHKVLDLVEGERDGVFWSRQEVVFSTDNDRYLCVEFYGDRKTNVTRALKPGDICEVTWTPTSTEYQERWFTKLQGVSVVPFQQAIPLQSET